MAEQDAAVISADIIGSSGMATAERKKLQAALSGFSRHAPDLWYNLKIQQYRGDSLQAIITENHWAALRIGLLLQSFLMMEGFKIRVSIGTGTVSFEGNDIITSDGSAFRASGLYLDLISKSGELISVAGNDENFTAEWQTHSVSLNYIIQRWTRQQAEAIYWKLQFLSQEEMAKKLKIKQPSVHQRLLGAAWIVVNKIIFRFETSIQLTQ